MTDMVKKPNHYQLLPEYEVKDINKALLDKIEESDFEMSLYQAGWYQQAMQYFMRFYAKNGLEDLKKGIQTMQFVVDDLERQTELEEKAKRQSDQERVRELYRQLAKTQKPNPSFTTRLPSNPFVLPTTWPEFSLTEQI